MTRNGKIARLAQPIREQINLRLQNGEEGKQIVAWLNTLPKVAALLAAEFNGQPINQNNLSNWKLGGYRDWEEQQNDLEAAKSLVADAAELGQVAGLHLPDQLALCLIARFAVALRQPPPDGDDPAEYLERLRRLSAGLARLRRGDQNALWLRIQQDKLDLQTKRHEAQVAARQAQPDPLEPGGKDGGFTKETLPKIEKGLNLF
jgi:hypothetical protein